MHEGAAQKMREKYKNVLKQFKLALQRHAVKPRDFKDTMDRGVCNPEEACSREEALKKARTEVDALCAMSKKEWDITTEGYYKII